MKSCDIVEMHYTSSATSINKPPRPYKAMTRTYIQIPKKVYKERSMSNKLLPIDSLINITSQSKKKKDRHHSNTIQSGASPCPNSIQIQLSLPNIRSKTSKIPTRLYKINQSLNLNPNMSNLLQNIQLEQKMKNEYFNNQSYTNNILIEKLKIDCINAPNIPYESTGEKIRMKKLFKTFGELTKITFLSQNKHINKLSLISLHKDNS